MIPRTYPSIYSGLNTKQTVYILSSISGLKAWKDYIPCKTITSPTSYNRYDAGSVVLVNPLGDITGLIQWKDYVPIYIDAGYTIPWSTNEGGYIPISSSEEGGGGGGDPVLMSKVGMFVNPTVDMTLTSVTGVGFLPNTIFALSDTITGNHSSTQSFGFGIYDSSNLNGSVDYLERSVSGYSQDAVATTNGNSRLISTGLIKYGSGHEGSLDTGGGEFNSDGFKIYFGVTSTSAEGDAIRTNYLCLGGTNGLGADPWPLLSYIGNYTQLGTEAVASTRTITTTLAPPKAVITISRQEGTTVATAPADFMNSIGVATASGQQFAMAGHDDSGAATSACRTAWSESDMLLVANNTGILKSSKLNSFGGTGFTYEVTATNTVDQITHWIVLGGNINAKAGVLTQPTATGSQSVTGIGFTPKAVMFFSVGRTAAGTSATDLIFMTGFSDGTNDSCTCHWSGNALADSDVYNLNSQSCCIGIVTAGAGTLGGQADMTSFGSDGFTLNWSTCDGTQRKVGYLALG
jgi:hypothetical protein